MAHQLIYISISEADVRALAEEHGIPYETALARAQEWSKHITETAAALCMEQLESVVIRDQP